MPHTMIMNAVSAPSLRSFRYEAATIMTISSLTDANNSPGSRSSRHLFIRDVLLHRLPACVPPLTLSPVVRAELLNPTHIIRSVHRVAPFNAQRTPRSAISRRATVRQPQPLHAPPHNSSDAQRPAVPTQRAYLYHSSHPLTTASLKSANSCARPLLS